MNVEFEKWQGCGNDFVLIHCKHTEQHLIKSLVSTTESLCSRSGFGIGADGVILIIEDIRNDPPTHTLKIINSDGSIAQTCGNGIRVASLSILKKIKNDFIFNEISTSGMCITLENDVECSIQFLGKTFEVSLIEKIAPSIDMGSTHSGETLQSQCSNVIQSCLDSLPEFKNLKVAHWQAVSLLNPHLVIFVDNFDIETFKIVGQFIQTSIEWDGVNVHFVDTESTEPSSNAPVQPLSPEAFKVWVWERGVGPTLACGSGASAVATTIYDFAMINRKNWIEIKMPGGSLWSRESIKYESIQLVGFGEEVFRGHLNI